MDEIKYIIIGSVITLFSALIIQVVSHTLTKIREKQKWLRETPDRLSSEVREYQKLTFEGKQLVAKYQEMVFEREQLLAKLKNNVDDQERKAEKLERKAEQLERKAEQLNSRERELLQITIVLKNQLRDALLGYDAKKMKFRANKMKIIIDEMDIQELCDIAEDKKPLPDLPD